jgi:hypothetical protein
VHRCTEYDGAKLPTAALRLARVAPARSTESPDCGAVTTRYFFLLFCLMTTSLASHAGERARFIEHSLNLHGITYRYQVFVQDGWTAKHT